MVENANIMATKDRGTGAHEKFSAKADEVNSMPDMPLLISASVGRVITNTKPVSVQITTVSINGSSKATKPSLNGSSVCTAAWAMAAEPSPASLEKAAR